MNTDRGTPHGPVSKCHRAAVLVLAAALAGLAAPACAPTRMALPASFALTRGGTPVPGRGVGVGLELGDGLKGEELLRKEVLTGDIVIGVADRVSFGASVYGGHEDRDPAGFVLATKVRLGAPLGSRTSSALRVGLGLIDRTDGSAQSEALTSFDIALPTELLVAGTAGTSRLSVYAGPRLVHESYRDHLDPAEGFEGWVPGGLAGVHLQVGHVHFFGEGTLGWRPATHFGGAIFEGGPIFLPSGGIIAHLGSPFGWGG